jgi:hypothetical protein
MKKEDIQRAYQIGFDMHPKLSEDQVKNLVQVGIQMAIQQEVIYDDDNSIIRLE